MLGGENKTVCKIIFERIIIKSKMGIRIKKHVYTLSNLFTRFSFADLHIENAEFVLIVTKGG